MCTAVKLRKHEEYEAKATAPKKFFLGLLRYLVVQLHCIFDFFVDFLFGLYYDRRVKKVSPVNNQLLLDSAFTLAEKIRNRQVSAEEVTRTFVERAKEVNGLINAVVEERYEEALEEARAVDKLLSKNGDCCTPKELEKATPFLGVPFTTKESNKAEGMLHTMGLTSRRDHRSKKDATAVRYMKRAGAILIAKTNIPELNLWCESRNNVYGQTCNPYNTTRTVGGSSGGDAAITAACGVPFAIGSDIGGSIRMPAFFNGVFGHKPTGGLTPIKGIGLRQTEDEDSMVQVGPLCKRATDLAPLLKVLVSENISRLSLDAPVDLKTLSVFYQESSGDLRASKVNGSMRNALSKAVRHFEELTGLATKIKIPGSEYSFKLWRYWMTRENLDFKSSITNDRYRASAKAEIVKLLFGQSELTLAAILKLVDEDVFPKENAEWAKDVTDVMREYLLEKLGKNGVLFYPSAPASARYHYSSFLRPYNFGYWCIFNVLKFPTCQVPMGLDDEGLPVGIQVVAAPYNDHLCFAVAEELERVFGGWTNPS